MIAAAFGLAGIALVVASVLLALRHPEPAARQSSLERILAVLLLAAIVAAVYAALVNLGGGQPAPAGIWFGAIAEHYG
jgi:hypothetical protein